MVSANEFLTEETPDLTRPRVRGDCLEGFRPCPYVGCKYHLFLDVKKSGNIRFNFKTENVSFLEKMADTCALDVADRGRHTAKVVGGILKVTHQSISRIEQGGLEKLQENFGDVDDQVLEA